MALSTTGRTRRRQYTSFDVYVATVDWNGQSRDVEVDVADAQPLLGMSLMLGSELRIAVVDGGETTIAQLP